MVQTQLAEPEIQTGPARRPLSRRGLLAGAGVAVAGAALTNSPRAAADDSTTSADLVGQREDAGYWRRVRELFTLDESSTFMNVGTVGSMPREALDTYDRVNREVARDATSGYAGGAAYTKWVTGPRTQAARGFGADLDEIALTRNTSDGMSKVLAGLPFKPGDEVLTTNHEHPGGLSPLTLARQRHGITVTMVPLPVGDRQRAEDYVALFEKAITPRTKLLMFSAPTYKTGTMLPIRLISEMAQKRGIPTLVDAAHVPGMFAYEYRTLGADFIVGSCAKWQCGPGGTGVVYARNKVLAEYNPNPLPEFWPVVASSIPSDGLPPRTSTRTAAYDLGEALTSIGNASLATYAALGATFTVWDRIGRKRIENYVLGLSQRLKKTVVDRWGRDALYSPMTDARLRTALTCFNPFPNKADVTDGAKSNRLVARVRDEYGYTIRNSSFPVIGSDKTHYPVRVSTHLFHDNADVDGVAKAIWRVAKALG